MLRLCNLTVAVDLSDPGAHHLWLLGLITAPTAILCRQTFWVLKSQVGAGTVMLVRL